MPFGRYDKFLATKDGVAVVEALTKLGRLAEEAGPAHRRNGQYARQTTAGNDRGNCLAPCFCLAKLAAIRRASSFVSRPVADLIYSSAYLNLQCVNLHLNNPKLIHTSTPWAMRQTTSGANMRQFLARFEKDQSAATAIEYALIAAGISVVIIAAVNGIGTQLNTTFSSVSTQLK